MSATPEIAARTLLARAEAEHAALAARVDELRSRLPDVARLLRERFGARRVVLFGSLAWGGFHAGSDVDIAVEGLGERALADAMTAASAAAGCTVELFDLDRMPEGFRRRVLEQGEALP
jgi:predicted nucleotidyltransferase